MKTISSPRQRDIYWVDFDPSKGSEQAGKRPAVVISGDSLNEHMPIHIVCPLTTRVMGGTGRVTVSANTTNGLKKDSDVLTMHIRTISPDRFGKKIGHISAAQLQQIILSLQQVLTY